MNLSTLLVFALVCVGALSLRHPRTSITQYNQTAELDQLSRQQQQFESQLAAMQSDLERVTSSLRSSSSDEQKVGILEDAVTRHRELVFQSSKTLIPAFNVAKCTCQELSPEQRQSTLAQLESVKADVYRLQRIVRSLPTCKRNIQVARDLDAQVFFIENIQSIIKQRCNRKAILTPTIWQTNLNAANWILGEQTLDDVVEEYFQRSTTYDNVTNCPASTPFFNGRECINCPREAPIWNLYSQECVSCPTGTVYQGQSRSCVQGGAESANCPAGSTYDASSNSCISEVTTCPPGTLLDTKSKMCIKIITCKNQFFNKETQQCEDFTDCPGAKLDKLTNKCVPFTTCPDGMFLDRENNKCVAFLSCPQGQELNRKNNRCEGKQCPRNSILNTDTGLCVKRPVIYRFAASASNVIEGSTTQQSYNEQINNAIAQNPNALVKTCPDDTPYSLIVSCVACGPEAPAFNLDLQKCGSCPRNMEYDAQNKKCKIILLLTDNKAKNLNLQGLKHSEFNKYQEGLVKINPNAIPKYCPEDSPFAVSGVKCISCPEGENFDILEQKCGGCPEGKTWNEESSTCA